MKEAHLTPQQHRRPRPPFAAFAAIVVTAVFFKLWLTSNIRTIPLNAPHDASNFLEHAKRLVIGHWFGSYNDLTLIKGPFFPIYLAFVHETGLSLATTHVLLTAFACVVACLALRPIIRKSGVLAALFLFLFFDPFTYNSDTWLAMRSQVNPSLALLSVGCAMAFLVRRRAPWKAVLPWALGLSASFAAFWLTREEAVWLVPCLVIILAPYLAYTVHRMRGELRPRLFILGLPIIVWFAANNAVATINGAVYGWRTVTEIQAPEFVAAYSSLARLDPGNTNLAVAVPKAARLQAYRVSPASRELEPFLESSVGDNWRQESCRRTRICDDTATPFFGYALRDAVALTGHYDSGADARDFYVKISNEIDRACDSSQIRCGPKRGLFLPAGLTAHLPDAIAAFATGTMSLIHLESLNMSQPPYPTPPAGIREDYEFILPSVDLVRDRIYVGWLVHKPVRTVQIAGSDDPYGQTIVFQPSPDVAHFFGAPLTRQGFDTANVRFEIKTTCLAGCTLALTNSGGTTTQIPLSPDTRDYRNSTAIYHLDSVANTIVTTFDEGARTAIVTNFAQAYQRVVPALLMICALLIGGRFVRIARGAKVPSYFFLVLGVVVSVGALVAILSVITLFGVYAFNAEYMGALFPLIFLAIGLTISLEGTQYYRLARKFLRTSNVSQ